MTTMSEPALREQARDRYSESVAAEMALTGVALGRMFDRSERWGRAVIQEVKRAETAERQSAAVLPKNGNGQVGKAMAGDARTDVLSAVPAAVERQPVAVERQPLRQRRGAVFVSWASFGFGVAVSIMANVAHTFHPSAAQLTAWQAAGHQVAEWRPEVGAALAAAFWPVALLLAVEVLSRVRWQRGFWWGAARYGGTGAVALVAAVMSYRHMAGLLGSFGEDSVSAHLGPLGVDGLMVVAGFALLSMGSGEKE